VLRRDGVELAHGVLHGSRLHLVGHRSLSPVADAMGPFYPLLHVNAGREVSSQPLRAPVQGAAARVRTEWGRAPRPAPSTAGPGPESHQAIDLGVAPGGDVRPGTSNSGDSIRNSGRIPATASVTQGHGEWPPSSRLRTLAREAPVSAADRQESPDAPESSQWQQASGSIPAGSDGGQIRGGSRSRVP